MILLVIKFAYPHVLQSLSLQFFNFGKEALSLCYFGMKFRHIKPAKYVPLCFLELFTYQDTILIAYSNHKVGNFATTINFITFV